MSYSASSILTKKLALSAMLVAVAVVGSAFIQFPFLGSKLLAHGSTW